MSEVNPSGTSELNSVDSVQAALLAKQDASEPAPIEETEVTTDELETTEEVEALADDAEELKAESTDEAEESDELEPDAEPDAPRFQTLAELADAVDMSLDDFMSNIKGTVKQDGKEVEITLAEMRDGQQREADYRRKTMELAEDRKTFADTQSTRQAEYVAELEKAGQIVQLAQSQLTSDFDSIDWTGLQASDSAQYVLKRQQFGERQAQINQAIEQGTQQANTFKAKQTEDASAKDQVYLQEQEQLLTEALPTWKEPATRKAEAGKVGDYLTGLGFSPEDIGKIKDHRILVMASVAMNAGKQMTNVDLAKKKVAKVPKLVKSSARQNRNQGKADQLKKLTAKVSGGNTQDLANLLIARSN